MDEAISHRAGAPSRPVFGLLDEEDNGRSGLPGLKPVSYTHLAAAESRSEHPVARAVTESVKGGVLEELPQPESFESLTGRGIAAQMCIRDSFRGRSGVLFRKAGGKADVRTRLYTKKGLRPPGF